MPPPLPPPPPPSPRPPAELPESAPPGQAPAASEPALYPSPAPSDAPPRSEFPSRPRHEAPEVPYGSLGIYPAPEGYGEAVPYPDDPSLPGPGAHMHEGFFLRLSAGLGAGFTRYHERYSDDEQAIKTRGLSTSFELILGGALRENLILHGSVAYQNIRDAWRSVDGEHDVQWRAVDTVSVLLGGGVTYYFMPAHVYVTAVAGVMGLAENRDDRTVFKSRAGVGSTLSVGKEWWIGSTGEWALGGALRGSFYTANASIFNELQRVYGADVGMVLSVTLN